MRKTKQDNDVTNYIGEVYVENDIQLFFIDWIGCYEENHIG